MSEDAVLVEDSDVKTGKVLEFPSGNYTGSLPVWYVTDRVIVCKTPRVTLFARTRTGEEGVKYVGPRWVVFTYEGSVLPGHVLVEEVVNFPVGQGQGRKKRKFGFDGRRLEDGANGI